MDYTYSFLQCKEAKPRERCLMRIFFFKLKKQKGGNHWLYSFLLASWGIKIEGTISYTYFFYQSQEAKQRKPWHTYVLSFNSRIQNRRDHMLPKSLPWIKGNQTEEAMKSANSFLIEGNRTKESMSCAFSFLQSKKQNGEKHWLYKIFAPQEEKTEESLEHTFSCLQCKKAKPRKWCLVQIPFFNLKKQKGRNHWLYIFLLAS